MSRQLASTVVCLGTVVQAVAPPAFGRVISSAPQPRPAVLETIAGSGFCQGDTVIDRAGARVAAVAVDGSGRVYVEAGPPARGTIRVTDTVGTRLLRTGVPGGEVPVDPLDPPSPGPSASRLAGDKAGVLVADRTSVVAVDHNGSSVTPVAGRAATGGAGGSQPSTGDGGPALAAGFAGIRSIATDEAHNLYISDEVDTEAHSFRVRFMNRSASPVTFYGGTPFELRIDPGHVETIAGGALPVSADGAPALQALLAGVPPSMAVAGDRLYLGLYEEGGGGATGARVRMLNLGATSITVHGVTVPPGYIQTVAGHGRAGFGGDGGPARSAAFSYLPGIAATTDGSLYIADQLHHRVRKIDAGGNITTVAGVGDVGSGDGGFNGNDQPADEARLDSPFDVKIGSQGLVYVSDAGNSQLRAVDSSGMIRLVPGHGPSWSCVPASRDGRPPEFPQSGAPSAVDVDRNGSVFFATVGGVRMLQGPGRVETLDARSAFTHQATAAARPPDPVALSVTRDGLYVLDANGQLSFKSRSPHTVQAHGKAVAPGGWAAVAQLDRTQVPVPITGVDNQSSTPGGSRGRRLYPSIVADAEGSVFLADPARHRVTEFDHSGKSTVFAGDGAPQPRGSCCTLPAGLAVDRSGNLYVADAQTRQVWLANRGSAPLVAHGQEVPAGVVAPVAGSGAGGLGGDEGGRALETALPGLRGLAVDGKGVLYLAVVEDHSVRRLDSAGAITTLAGVGRAAFNGDGQLAAATALDTPLDIAVDRCGNILIADAGNDRLRRVNLAPGCDPFGEATAPGRPAGAGWPLKLASLLGALGAVATVIVSLRRRARHARG